MTSAPVSVPPETRAVVTTTERPDLAGTVAEWLWHESWQRLGYTLEETEAELIASRAAVGPPQTFVLLANGRPVGTARLTTLDLDERAELTPWLADVFVIPEARGRGYVRDILAAFDTACAAASISKAWLYTNTAERIYARAGWQVVETIERAGKLPVVLMRRDYALAIMMPDVL